MDESIDSGPIILQRDVPATLVPLGTAGTLLQGTEVRITNGWAATSPWCPRAACTASTAAMPMRSG